MANAFVAGFDYTHPMLRDLKIFDMEKDNVAKRLKTFNYSKEVDVESGAIILHDEKQGQENVKKQKLNFNISYKASFNEIEYSTRLNSGFKRALTKSESLEDLLSPLEKDY